MKNNTHQGFTHLALVFLLLVAAVVGFAGYKVAQNRNNSTTASSVASPSTAQVVPAIKSTADLNNVESALNNQNIDNNLNPDSLNQDVQSLL